VAQGHVSKESAGYVLVSAQCCNVALIFSSAHRNGWRQ